MKISRKVTRSAEPVGIWTGGIWAGGISIPPGRIPGSLRNMVIALFPGAGSGCGAFFTAIRIPDLLRRKGGAAIRGNSFAVSNAASGAVGGAPYSLSGWMICVVDGMNGILQRVNRSAAVASGSPVCFVPGRFMWARFMWGWRPGSPDPQGALAMVGGRRGLL